MPFFTYYFRIFLQYIFFKQWTALREYANEKGIQIIGDIPIYVSADSSDVWTHPKLFKLKPDRSPKLVAWRKEVAEKIAEKFPILKLNKFLKDKSKKEAA